MTQHRGIESQTNAYLRAGLITVAAIFFAEVVAVVAIELLDPRPFVFKTLLDASLMILLILPVLYLFSFRPMIRSLHARARAEEDLRQARDLLEQRVEERTEDLTRTNRELRESEQRYRRLFEGNLAGVFRSTLGGRLLDCNAAFAQIFGYEAQEELLKLPTTTLYARQSERAEFLVTLRRTGEHAFESEGRKRDGSPVWVLGRISLVSDPAFGGEILEGTVFDISRRKWAEDDLLAAREELERRVQERTAELAATNIELLQAVERRTRAQEALQRYAEKQAALYAVASAATHQRDVETLLGDVVESVLALFEADAGWILMPGSDPASLPNIVAAKGLPTTLREAEICLPLSACEVCGPWFAQGARVSEAPIITECPRLPEARLTAAGFDSHVGLLLPAGGRVLAILNLAWRTVRAHDEPERSLLRTIAGQIGFALENALLYRAERAARAAAETIGGASIAIGRTLDLETVLRTLLEHLRRLVPYDRARVMLLDGDSRLKVRAMSDRDGTIRFPEPDAASFDAGLNPLIRDLLSSTTGMVIADTHTHPEWGPRMSPEFEHSWMGLPLVSGGRVIGLYSLSKVEAGFYTAEHLVLAEALSAPAAVAIENAALFAELAAKRRHLQTLSRQLVELQENERHTVARELHDGAGQALTSLMVGLHLLDLGADSPVAVRRQTAALKRIADGVQETLHRVASGLRPAALDHLGLAPALGQLVEDMVHTGGPNIAFEAIGLGEERLGAEVETTLYRIAQEAVTNAVKHAGAREISLVLERSRGRLLMVIEDDGRGFDVEAALGSDRLGLVGMRERVEMLGGRLTVESSPGSGTTIVAEVAHAG